MAVGKRKTVRRRLADERGQTVVEYLLLLAMTFVVGYLMVTGPIANFTREMLTTIRNNIRNVVRTGEMSEGEEITPQSGNHPGNPERLRPLHL